MDSEVPRKRFFVTQKHSPQPDLYATTLMLVAMERRRGHVVLWKTKWKLEKALEFLNGPDFIPAASEPARIEFDGPRHFKFPTPRPGKVEENNIVYGRLYRCAEHWQERSAIILLDGGFAIGYYSVFPLLARRFNRAGFNVVPLVAPYNLQRRPRRPMEENCLELRGRLHRTSLRFAR